MTFKFCRDTKNMEKRTSPGIKIGEARISLPNL